MTTLITNSRLKSFRACPRAHQLRYNDGIRSLETSDALAFGTAMHAALEAWWIAHMRDDAPAADEAAQGKIRESGLDDFQRAKAEVLMAGYAARWSAAMADFEILGVEVEFRARAVTPTGKRARGIRLAGKIDVIVRRRSDGTVWLIEHKTSGADLSPGSAYWARLRMDSQVSMYFDGAAALKHDVAGCIYDVIEKPAIRPLKATPVEARKFTKDGRLYANQREADETVDEYKARVAQALIDEPEAYFQRSEVVRLAGELEAARADVAETAALIQLTARKGIAPRNTDACRAYGRACDYLSICDGTGSADDETKFQRVASVHPELTA